MPDEPSHPRYDIRGELGRGGLGRVLAAHDRRLDRGVALKELLEHDDDARTRFAREARVTARLQHPSIVPLYDIDAWPGGESFYAMKAVSGRSLDRVIADAGSLDERLALVPNVIAVAEAVAYAHGEGVIHRDLKPANVLVGDFGETVVIDWGLAKDLREAEPPAPRVASGSGDKTVAGTVLGTPSYMPPEQAKGGVVDERADVYAIGALLYHVLAGDPPFREPSAEATLAAVEAGPPPALTDRQPGVPRDLAAIIARAMARDPAARYPTAKELALDLRRFATGQLVRAHVYSLSARLRRFLRRNRAAVLVGGIMLAVLVAASLLAIGQIVRERNLAEQQRGAAEKLVAFVIGGQHDRLERIGRLDLLQGVASEVEGYYRALPGADPRLDAGALANRAAALQILADVRWDQGDLAGAEGFYRSSIAVRDRALALEPGNGDRAAKQIEAQMWLGAALRLRGERAEARSWFEAASRAAAALAAAHPDEARWRFWEAQLARRSSTLKSDLGDHPGALAAYREALARLEAIPAAARDREVDRELATLHMAIAAELGTIGDVNGERPELAAALAITTRLAAANPDDARLQLDVVYAERQLARSAFRQADLDRAGAHAAEARALMERLLLRDPGNVRWLGELRDVVEVIGWVHEGTGRIAAAHASYGEQLELARRLVALDPRNTATRIALSATYRNLGDIAVSAGDLDVARAQYDAAIGIASGSADIAPGDVTWLSEQMLAYADLGDVDLAGDDLAMARVEFQIALTGRATLVAMNPRSEVYRRGLSRGLSSLGRVLGELGEDGLAPAEQGVALSSELARSYPDSYLVQERLADAHVSLAVARKARGDLDGALASATTAVTNYRRLTGPSDADDTASLVDARRVLAAIQAARGDRAGAVTSLRTGLAELEPFARTPGVWRTDQAEIHVEIAKLLGPGAAARRELVAASAVLEPWAAAGRPNPHLRRVLDECRRGLAP